MPEKTVWNTIGVSKTFIISVQCLVSDLSQDCYLCLTQLCCCSNSLPIYPMKTPKLKPFQVCILPWGLNSCHVSDVVILQDKRERSNMYPLVTGWLWKRLSIRQWKQALFSSLFQHGCVELSSLCDNSGIYSNWFCITRITSHYIVLYTSRKITWSKIVLQSVMSYVIRILLWEALSHCFLQCLAVLSVIYYYFVTTVTQMLLFKFIITIVSWHFPNDTMVKQSTMLPFPWKSFSPRKLIGFKFMVMMKVIFVYS